MEQKSFIKKENIESRISIQIYLEGNLPSEITNFKNALKSKLKDFKSVAGNRIEYIFIDPNNKSKEVQNEFLHSFMIVEMEFYQWKLVI